MSAFDEILSDKAAGEEPAIVPEIPSSESPVAPPTESASEPLKTEPETTAGEGAPTEEGKGEPATEDENQFILSGRDTEESLKTRHGDGWAIKTARRTLPLVSQAGSMQNLRHGAELISAVHNPEMTGTGLIQEIAKVSASRAQEFVNDIYWENVKNQPDMTAQGLFGIKDLTFEEAKKAILESREIDTPAEDDPADELANLSPALRREIEESRAMRTQFPELKREVDGFKSSREQEEIQTLGNELYRSVFSVVDERKKKLGLEVSPTDSDQVKFIKQDLLDYLSDAKIEAQFEANQDNMKLTDRAIAYIKKRDKAAAFAYQEPLQVAAEVTFEQMLKSPRVAHALSQLKSVMESQSKPKDPTAREEIVAGAPAGIIPEDAFEKGRQEGLSPFDVSQQLAKQGNRVAAR